MKFWCLPNFAAGLIESYWGQVACMQSPICGLSENYNSGLSQLETFVSSIRAKIQTNKIITETLSIGSCQLPEHKSVWVYGIPKEQSLSKMEENALLRKWDLKNKRALSYWMDLF